MVRRMVAMVALVLVAGMTLLPGQTAIAAAPPPPLDDCLKKGSFDIADPVCRLYSPERGNQFGPIAGTQIVLVERGVPFTLTAPGGAAIDFDPPKDQVCGENGCPRTTILWRRGHSYQHGIGYIAGCTATDVTCTVTYAPPLVGDPAEIYQVIYAEQYLGIRPTGNSRMFALYTPPTIYDVRLDPVDTSGARRALPSDHTAYAIRPGANPTQAECDDRNSWYDAAFASATFPVPDCITLPRGGYLDGHENWFEGSLPNDSGTWTVVAGPSGDPGVPLLSRPSPYRRLALTPANDDIRTTIVVERRPRLTLDYGWADFMDIGTTQIIDVIVAARGGEGGGLEGLTFADASIVTLAGSPDAALEIVGVSEEVPAGGFALRAGEQRVFQVELRAVGLGEGWFGATVAGKDDLGQTVRVQYRLFILVEYAESDGAGAPKPPIVERALDAGAGGSDVIEGTVSGTPETTVTVSLATSAIGADDTCTRLMSGDGVTGLGSFAVAIDTQGVGRFKLDGSLDPGRFVYGITAKGPSVSAVGECTPVAEVTPSVSIDDAEVPEGTGKGGTTSLVFTVRLSSPSESMVNVDVAAVDGSAAAPGDYLAAGLTTVTFGPGEVTRGFTVEVVRDAEEEPDEDFSVVLSNAVGATIAPTDGSGLGTIEDDDDAGVGVPTEVPDLRGTWSMELPLHPTLEIRTQDPKSGRVTGTMTEQVPSGPRGEGPGFTMIYKVVGSITGDRLVLRFSHPCCRTFKESGTLATQRGRLTATMTGTHQGRRYTYRIMLTDPRGGYAPAGTAGRG